MSALVRTLGVFLAFCVITGAVTAQTAYKAVEISLPAGDLAHALEKLGAQSGVQIMYEPAVAQGIRVAAVNGTLTVRNALNQLLAETDLKADQVNEKTVVLKRAEANKKPEPIAVEQDERSAANHPSPEPSAMLEEIVVTAQKREERLQDVPISITALTGDTLDRGTLEGVADTLRSVPGVAAVTDRNGMGASIAVRGVGGGALFAGSSAPIAYYLDSVPFGMVRTAFAPDSTAYDLERVEVLRGPQGTLYGATALNGVVRVLTKDADLTEFDIKARAMTSSTQYGGWNYRADAAANLPIIENKLAARLTAGYQDFSGWISRPNEQDANDSQVANARVKVKAQPVENLTIGLSAWISRGNYGAPSTGDDNRRHFSEIVEPITADYDVYAVNLKYDFGSVSLASSTSYFDFESSNVLDLHPFLGFESQQINLLNSEVLTEELILSSIGQGSWRWSLGTLFRDVDDRSVYFLPGLIPGNPVGGPFGFDDASQSVAIFGEATHVFVDGRLELTGGLRYFRDRVKTRDNSPGGTLSARDTFESTTPRVVLTWHPSTDTTVYASYSEGFRSGVLQTPEISAVGFPPAKPDKLTNYELGAKADLMDGRLSVELAGYFLDWKSVHQSLAVPINGTLYAGIVNGPSASGPGVDVTMIARPTVGLSFGGSLSANDLTLDSDVVAGNGALFSKGDRLNLSPKLTVGGFAGYEFPIGSSGFSAAMNVSASYISELSLRSLADGVLIVEDSEKQLIGRSALSLRAPARWEATLFVDNLTNEQDISQSNPHLNASSLHVDSWDTRPRPRTFGIQIDYQF